MVLPRVGVYTPGVCCVAITQDSVRPPRNHRHMTSAVVTEQPLELEPLTADAFLDEATEVDAARAAATRARLETLFGASPRRRAIVD